MGAKKEAKQVASKTVPAAPAETGVTDTITVANGQKVSNQMPCRHAVHRIVRLMIR